MTDTGAYSDVVFGLFRLLGYRFCPRLADIGGTRFWRIDPQADYGKLNVVSRHRLKLQRIAPHWDDMLRLGGSLLQGRVPATGIMRTLQVGENPTRLAQGIAEFGRIDKTLHSLRFIDDKDMRRGTLAQLNRGEGREHQPNRTHKFILISWAGNGRKTSFPASPDSHRSWVSGGRITGIRVCISATNSLGWPVIIVQVRSHSWVSGLCQPSHRPAKTNGSLNR
jgi:Tn3 transposase DDE domain